MIRCYLPIFLLAVGAHALAAEDGPAATPELVAQAEAKTRAKEWPEAAALWERVVKLNPVSGSYWSRLGECRREAKDYRNAIAALEKSLELRAGFPWADAYDIACCYALLGEKEPALKWLEKSFAMGFRSLKHAQDDSDLVSLRDEPRFRDLVALVDVSKMSRTEGWRYDLKLLARELKRLHYDLSKRPAPAGFDDLVRKLHDEIPNLTDHQIEVGLMKLARMAGDGHTEAAARYYVTPTRKSLPVEFYLFEEGLFITAAAPEHKELVGSRVLQFGDHAVPKVLAALDPIISRDNEIWTKFVAPIMLRQPQILNGLGLIPDGEKVTLTLSDAGDKKRTVTLAVGDKHRGDDWVDARAAAEGAEPLYLKNRKAAYWFEYLADSKTLYFQYNAVQNDEKETFEKFCGLLFEAIEKNAVDRLVIDVRWNSGGNNFLNKPLVHGLIRCDKVNKRGKLFVITGRNTFSAAQCGVTQIERHTEATFVGEPTGSCPNFVGETCPLTLPYSQMHATISDLYWQNSVAMDYRTWIAPQLYTPPTFAAYSKKRDLALEAILAYRPK